MPTLDISYNLKAAFGLLAINKNINRKKITKKLLSSPQKATMTDLFSVYSQTANKISHILSVSPMLKPLLNRGTV